MLRIGSVLPALIGASAPRQHRRADLQAARGDDVAALAVGVAHQRDVRGAVRVVLDALDLGRNAVLVAHEIDHAVVVLVPTALVAHRDVAVVVAAGVLLLRLEQRRFRLALVQVLVHHLHHGTAAGRSRFDFDDGHYAASPEKLSSWPGFSDTYAFLTWSRRPIERPKRLALPFWLTVATDCDLDLEHQLDGGLDLGLGRVAQDLEQHLVVLLADVRGLLGHDRRDQHLGQAAFVELAGHGAVRLMRTSP